MLLNEVIFIKHLAQYVVHLTNGFGQSCKRVDTKGPKFAIVHLTHAEDKDTECEGNGHLGPWGAEVSVGQDFLWHLGATRQGSPFPILYANQNSTVVNDFVSRFSGA